MTANSKRTFRVTEIGRSSQFAGPGVSVEMLDGWPLACANAVVLSAPGRSGQEWQPLRKEAGLQLKFGTAISDLAPVRAGQPYLSVRPINLPVATQ